MDGVTTRVKGLKRDTESCFKWVQKSAEHPSGSSFLRTVSVGIAY